MSLALVFQLVDFAWKFTLLSCDSNHIHKNTHIFCHARFVHCTAHGIAFVLAYYRWPFYLLHCPYDRKLPPPPPIQIIFCSDRSPWMAFSSAICRCRHRLCCCWTMLSTSQLFWKNIRLFLFIYHETKINVYTRFIASFPRSCVSFCLCRTVSISFAELLFLLDLSLEAKALVNSVAVADIAGIYFHLNEHRMLSLATSKREHKHIYKSANTHTHTPSWSIEQYTHTHTYAYRHFKLNY